MKEVNVKGNPPIACAYNGTGKVEKEEHPLTPNMQAFFDKLLDIKKTVKKRRDQETTGYYFNVLDDIYQSLDEIIKEKK